MSSSRVERSNDTRMPVVSLDHSRATSGTPVLTYNLTQCVKVHPDVPGGAALWVRVHVHQASGVRTLNLDPVAPKNLPPDARVRDLLPTGEGFGVPLATALRWLRSTAGTHKDATSVVITEKVSDATGRVLESNAQWQRGTERGVVPTDVPTSGHPAWRLLQKVTGAREEGGAPLTGAFGSLSGGKGGRERLGIDGLHPFNPFRLSQSKHLRDLGLLSTKTEVRGESRTVLHGLKGVSGVGIDSGLFGLIKAPLPDAPPFLQSSEGPKIMGALAPPSTFQVHGFFAMDGEGRWFGLVKGQILPRPLGGALLREDKMMLLPPAPDAVDPDSRFIKGYFGGDQDSAGALLNIGQSAENDAAPRARRAYWLGGGAGRDPETEELNRFNVVLGTPSRGRYSSLGAGVGFEKDEHGQWKLSRFDVPVEWGPKRIQLFPTATRDPDSGQLNGVSVIAGNGYTLGELTVYNDTENPRVRYDAGDRSDTLGRILGPSVSFGNPTHRAFAIGATGGPEGISGYGMGLGLDRHGGDDTAVTVAVRDAVTPENLRAAEVKARQLHDEVTNGTLNLLDLPEGTAVSTILHNAWSFSLFGVANLFLGTGGLGKNGHALVQVVKKDNTTTITRSTSDGALVFGSIGIAGVGPGFRHRGATEGATSFTVGRNASDEVREAVDLYTRTGLFPGAERLGTPEDIDAVQTYRRMLHNPERYPNARQQWLIEQAFETAYVKLNQLFVETYTPGDEVLEGLHWTSATTGKTGSLDDIFVVPVGRTERSEGKTRQSDRRVFRTSLNHDNLGIRISREATAVADSDGETQFMLTVQTDRFRRPELLQTVRNNLPSYALDAAQDNRRVEGDLGVRLNRRQLVALEQARPTDWEALARDASMLFSGTLKQERFEPGNNVDLLRQKLGDAAHQIAQRYQINKKRLAEVVGGVDSAAAFKALSVPEQMAFIEAVVVQSTVDDDWPRALGPLAYVGQGKGEGASEEAQAQAFTRLIAATDDMPLKFLGTLPQAKRGNDVASDLLVYLDNPKVPEDLRQEVQLNSYFDWEVPGEKRWERRSDSDLRQALRDAWGAKKVFAATLYRNDADRIQEILAVLAQRHGADAPWRAVTELNIDVARVLERFGDSPDAQLRRKILAEVLLMGVKRWPTDRRHRVAIAEALGLSPTEPMYVQIVEDGPRRR